MAPRSSRCVGYVCSIGLGLCALMTACGTAPDVTDDAGPAHDGARAEAGPHVGDDVASTDGAPRTTDAADTGTTADDASAMDATTPPNMDADTTDAVSMDTVTRDTGTVTMEAGRPDAGVVDVGTPDVGVVDAGPVNVAIDPTHTYQTFRGWELTLPGLGPGVSVSTATRDRIISMAVADGFNRARLEASGNNIETAGAPSGNPDSPFIGANDDADPNHINPAGFRWIEWDDRINTWYVPYRNAVLATGTPFFLNLCYVGFATSTAFQQTSSAEYAEFTLAVLQHLQGTFRLTPDQWEARLEPDTGYTITGTQVGQNIVAAANRVHPAGWPALLFGAPSASHPGNLIPLTTAVLAVTGTAPLIRELTYHRYGTAPSSTLDMLWTQAQALHAETAQLEHIGADQNELYADLTQANVSSWSRYVLVGSGGCAMQGGMYCLDVTTGAVTLQGGAQYLRLYSRAIRPGMVRLGASSTSATIAPVVFRAPSGRTVVVANTTAGATLRIGGLPAGTYNINFATTAVPMGSSPAVTIRAGEVLVATIPAAGVITVAP